MLGSLGGVIMVSMLLIRDARYVAIAALTYTLVAIAWSFGVPL